MKISKRQVRQLILETLDSAPPMSKLNKFKVKRISSGKGKYTVSDLGGEDAGMEVHAYNKSNWDKMSDEEKDKYYFNILQMSDEQFAKVDDPYGSEEEESSMFGSLFETNISKPHKISRSQLRNIITEVLNESDDARSKAMDAALSSIRSQFGSGAIVDTGAGDKLSNDWMKFVMRQSPKYTDILLHIWDHLIDGDNPASVRDIYFNDLDKNSGIAGAITFYGRRIRPGQQYLTGTQLGKKIAAKRAERAEQASQRQAQAAEKRSAQDSRLQGVSLQDLKSRRQQFLDSLERISSDTRYPYGRNRGDVKSVTSYQKPDGSAFTQAEIQMLEDYDTLDARQHGSYAALAGTTSSALSNDSSTLTITYDKYTAG